MPEESRPTVPKPNVLATDLDGTLIPLEGNEQNRADLKVLGKQLSARAMSLAFVTGRHLSIVEEAIVEHQLPQPDWILCDVGTTICQQSADGWTPSAEYRDHLASICECFPIDRLQDQIPRFDGVVPQEVEKQGLFKLSFYVDPSAHQNVSERMRHWLSEHQAPYDLIDSVDPFSGDGLIDLLPNGVSKAYAVEWWREHHGFDRPQIVFAGDSGNDLAALTAGYRTIVVGNADRTLAARVAQHHDVRGTTDLLYLANAPATSGVLEGCHAFGLFARAAM